MELRRRPNAASSSGDSGGANSRSDSPESSGAKIDRNFTRCIVSVFFVLVSVLTLTVLFSSEASKFLPKTVQEQIGQILDKFGLEPRVHAVVIDAGSTGSRVLAFTFKRDIFDGNQLKLEDELWKQNKPGLSSFALEPAKAGESVQQLLNSAKERIPAKYWSKTPITLKATAGLRLLPQEQSEAIIIEVKKVLENSGFQTITDEKLIEIMNPMEEGLFAWFTVNYLLGSFQPNKHLSKSAASLDLGGGSTQITFAPKTLPVSGTEGRKHFIHKVDILGGEPLSVYSHSYLGLGLMAARQAIFVHEGSSKSSCVVSKTKSSKFNFHGNSYDISSSDNAGFETCLNVVKAVIIADNVHKPEELAGRDVVAFSYFYDLAIEAGLISGLEGSVTISDYKKAAIRACGDIENSSFTSLNACLDLTFLYGLLNSGYGLPESKLIKLYKKINGHEASWALGVGYHMINNH